MGDHTTLEEEHHRRHHRNKRREDGFGVKIMTDEGAMWNASSVSKLTLPMHLKLTLLDLQLFSRSATSAS